MEKVYSPCLLIAAKMYGVKSPKLLPPKLYDCIIEVDELCRIDNGTLRSRQVIASIVQQYKINREK